MLTLHCSGPAALRRTLEKYGISLSRALNKVNFLLNAKVVCCREHCRLSLAVVGCQYTPGQTYSNVNAKGPARPAPVRADTEMSLATRSNQFRICTLGSIVVAIDLLKWALCKDFLIPILSVENVFTCRVADVFTAVSVELSSRRVVIYRSLLPM